MISEKQNVIFSDGTIVGLNSRPDGKLEVEVNQIPIGVLELPGYESLPDAPVTIEPPVNATATEQGDSSPTIESDVNQEG